VLTCEAAPTRDAARSVLVINVVPATRRIAVSISHKFAEEVKPAQAIGKRHASAGPLFAGSTPVMPSKRLSPWAEGSSSARHATDSGLQLPRMEESVQWCAQPVTPEL
jgi:hypothetical protein